MSEYGYEITEYNGADCMHITLEAQNADNTIVDAYIPIDSIYNSYRMYRGINGMYGDIDHVDDCMRSLGIAFNRLDPDGMFKGVLSEETFVQLMKTVHEDYRKLSDAILTLRSEGKNGTDATS